MNAKMNSKGEQVVRMKTTKKSAKGTYKVSISAAATGYNPASATKSFRLN